MRLEIKHNQYQRDLEGRWVLTKDGEVNLFNIDSRLSDALDEIARFTAYVEMLEEKLALDIFKVASVKACMKCGKVIGSAGYMYVGRGSGEYTHLKCLEKGSAPPEAKCATCLFFYKKLQLAAQPGRVEGYCRRYVPTGDGFPNVPSTEWCGEYKSKQDG